MMFDRKLYIKGYSNCFDIFCIMMFEILNGG